MTLEGMTGSRWRLALILSLGLNLAMLGFLVGALVAGRPPTGHGHDRDVSLGPLSGALTPADRRALRSRFLEASPEFRAERREMQADFRTLADGLRAETWDRAGAEAILARQAERGMRRLRLGQQLFLDHVSTLEMESRRELADRIEGVLRAPGTAAD